MSCGLQLLQAEERNAQDADAVPGAGNIWLRVAIDADTKIVPCVMLGSRSAADAEEFIADLASRL